MIKVLFAGHPSSWGCFVGPLKHAFRSAALDVELSCDHAPADVDYIVLEPSGPVTDFSPFANTKAVLNLWAGVEELTGNATLTQPLARMVDPGLTEGMTEWVVGNTLRYHLEIDDVLARQSGSWHRVIPPLARHRKVGILGLGTLGLAAAEALQALKFDVAGWSRRQKTASFPAFAGEDGLDRVLGRSEILILLLPQTPATENLLNRERISLLPKGARLLNPGRGPLIDDDALIGALDEGRLAHATLDVFRQEPLPEGHAFWCHPRITVSPHVASDTRPETASGAIAENIRRCESGEPLIGLVDRQQGY